MQENKSSYKIYSRKRVKLFKPKKYTRVSREKKLKIFYVLGILTITISTYVICYKAIDPIFQEICSDEAKSIATKITNEQSTKVMREHSYDEMFTIQKDENGNVQMINANIFAIDEITSDIAIYIQEALENSETSKVKLSIGSFTGIKILSGTGPDMNIKLSSTGEVATDLRSEFVSQGINQTIHRIYLQIDCTVNILTPFKTIEESISNQVLLAENVIIGQIPSTYYNFEGTDSDQSKLEIIN